MWTFNDKLEAFALVLGVALLALTPAALLILW